MANGQQALKESAQNVLLKELITRLSGGLIPLQGSAPQSKGQQTIDQFGFAPGTVGITPARTLTEGFKVPDFITNIVDSIPSREERLLQNQSLVEARGNAGLPDRALLSAAGLTQAQPEQVAGATNISQPVQAGLPQDIQSVAEESSKPKTKSSSEKGSGLKIPDILKELAIPLATTAIGLGVPGALPGAAGFQSGFGAEQLRQRQLQESEGETILVDEEGNELGRLKTGKGDNVKVIKKDQLSEFARIFGKELGIEFEEANVKTDTKAAKKKVEEGLSGRQKRAKQALEDAGRDTGSDSINKFLELNPNF